MKLLVDHQIDALCRSSGMIDPYDPILLNPASLDIRVGNTVKVETPQGWKNLNISACTPEKPFNVAPKEAILVGSLEMFDVPNNIACEFRLKSSRGREFWNQMLAVWIDPGFHNSCLTMELCNENRFHRLPLYPGLRIGQLLIYELDVAPTTSYATTGRYNGDRVVMGSKG